MLVGELEVYLVELFVDGCCCLCVDCEFDELEFDVCGWGWWCEQWLVGGWCVIVLCELCVCQVFQIEQ